MSAGRNETNPTCNESTCWLCGAPLDVQPTGRPRRFCSPAHRVRYHRLRKRPAVTDPQPLIPGQRGSAEPAELLRDLADDLGDLQPIARVAELRHLATYAQELQELLDTIATSAWALHEFTSVGYDFERLQDHRHTLERLLELDDLADDIQQLARHLRNARQLRDELLWAADELEQPGEQDP